MRRKDNASWKEKYDMLWENDNYAFMCLHEKHRLHLVLAFLIGVILTSSLLLITESRPVIMNGAIGEPRVSFLQAGRVPDLQWGYDNLTQTLTVYNVIEASTTMGSSMRPSIWSGNTCFLLNYTGVLGEGQMISYTNENGRSVLHRVEALYEQYILVRGDNNPEQERIQAEQIEGIVGGCLYT